MSNLKQMKVGQTAYDIKDAGAVRYDEAQTLTDGQKTQARGNIGAYAKPASGIPSTDMDALVQTSLGKADSALQSHQDISGKEDKSNKTTALSPASTNTQYPGAKVVYEAIQAAIASGGGATNNKAVSDVTNPAFDSQAASIVIDTRTTTITDINGVVIDFGTMQVGSTIWVIEVGVPDRWIGSKQTVEGGYIVTLYQMETAKPAVLDVRRNGVTMLNLGVADILTEGTPTEGSTKLLESGGAKAYIDNAVAAKGAAALDSPMVEGKDYQLGGVSQLGLTLPASGGYWGMIRVCFTASSAFTPVISGTYAGDTIAECVSGKTYEYLFSWNGASWVLSILYY